MEINKHNQDLLDSYEKGYRVINGCVFYKSNQLKKSIAKCGYYRFSIRNKDGNQCIVFVHRLVAYQKYGNEIFKENIQVRHFDNNALNNKEENILIGTPSDNGMDKDEAVRKRSAIIASSYTKKHDHEKIIKLRSEGVSYKKIMEQFNIKSKGTISFIINKSIEMKAGIAQLVEQQTENLCVGGSIPPPRTKA